MQAWPPLNCLAPARSAAILSISAPSSMITGDLPPSSSVTVARCLAAAAITILPTRVLPVKKMWLNGSSSSACATSTSPSNSATSFSSNTSRMILPATRAVAGHRSVSLTMQQLPAATAAATGPSVSPSGKFHGPRIRHTPRASGTIIALSFGFLEGVTSVGFIQSSRLSMLSWMLPTTFSTSVTRISPSGLRVSSQHRGDDLVGARLDRGLQPGELGLALVRAGRLDVPLVLALQGEDPRDFLAISGAVCAVLDIGISCLGSNGDRRPCRSSSGARKQVSSRLRGRAGVDTVDTVTDRRSVICATSRGSEFHRQVDHGHRRGDSCGTRKQPSDSEFTAGRRCCRAASGSRGPRSRGCRGRSPWAASRRPLRRGCSGRFRAAAPSQPGKLRPQRLVDRLARPSRGCRPRARAGRRR